MAHQPDDPGARRRQLRQAPAAHPRVQLDVDGNAVGHERGRGAKLQPARPGGLDLALLGGPEDENPCSGKCPAQLERLGDGRDPERRRAGVERRCADGHGSMSVSVCLDDGPELGRTGEAGAEESRVVPDRRKVDRDEGPHHLRHSGEAVILRPHASRNGLDDAGSVLGAAYGAATSRKVGAMLLCRIGVHRWSFESRQVDDQDTSTHTEIVFARCRRKGCRHGAWAVVNVDVYAAAKAPAAARAFATRIGQERPLSA